MSLTLAQRHIINALALSMEGSSELLELSIAELRRITEDPPEIPTNDAEVTPIKKSKKSKKSRKSRKPSGLNHFKKVHDDRDRAYLKALVDDGQETIKSKTDKDIKIMTKSGKIQMTTLSSYQGQLWSKLSKDEQQTYSDNALAESSFGSETDTD